MSLESAENAVQQELRKIPSVTVLLALCAQNGVFGEENDALRGKMIREVLADVRARVLVGLACPGQAEIFSSLKERRIGFEAQCVRRVINATGIPLHTNLGRSPLPREVLARVAELSAGYCSLEMDLQSGQRGKRAAGAKEMLKAITGAEDALIVNNGAAAVYLTLAALAFGKKVLVSRGELVQIGGGFRVPDILAASGAALKEVGTTNITDIEDFSRAVDADTALLMKIHRSNFVISGHTAEPALEELAALAQKTGRPLVFDLGSGSFVRWRGYDARREPTVQDLLRGGVDLVCFSGDKLVGGPQSGVIAGRAELIAKIFKHPMYRAMRAGRLTTVALQEVLKYYVHGRHRELAHWMMIEMSDEVHALRSSELQLKLESVGIACEVLKIDGAVGGGAAPESELPSLAVAIRAKNAEAFLQRLREQVPAIIPRVDSGTVLVDVRTVLSEEFEDLITGIKLSYHNQV